MTHQELVERAVAWLKNSRHCPLVIARRRAVTLEHPDAIGFWITKPSVLIECKASRSDFRADRKKFFREFPAKGMGYFRYFLTPAGLVAKEEVPANWGLLEVRGRTVRQAKKATPFSSWNLRGEMALLMSRFVHGIEPHEDTATGWGDL